jgi:hypothetical protein
MLPKKGLWAGDKKVKGRGEKDGGQARIGIYSPLAFLRFSRRPGCVVIEARAENRFPLASSCQKSHINTRSGPMPLSAESIDLDCCD